MKLEANRISPKNVVKKANHSKANNISGSRFHRLGKRVINGLRMSTNYRQTEEKELEALPCDTTMNFPPFDKYADVIAIKLANGQKINISSEKCSMPEILVDCFKNKVSNGDYSKIGIDNTNTDIIIFDQTNFLKSEFETLPSSYGQLFENWFNEDDKKKVIFVKNFDAETMLFDDKYSDKIQLIPLSKDLSEMDYGQTIEPEEFNAKKTKELISYNPELVKFEQYAFSKEAIDLTIKYSKLNPNDLPRKALELLKSFEKAHTIINPDKKEIDAQSIQEIVVKFPELLCYKTDLFKVFPTSNTRFTDIAGYSQIQEQVETSLIKFLKEDEKFNSESDIYPRGIIIKGSYTTEKKALVNAISGETSTPVVSVLGSDIKDVEMVDNLFRFAKIQARKQNKKSVIICIDDFDKLTQDSNISEKLASRLDKIKKDANPHVVVIGLSDSGYSPESGLSSMISGLFGGESKAFDIRKSDTLSKRTSLMARSKSDNTENLDLLSLLGGMVEDRTGNNLKSSNFDSRELYLPKRFDIEIETPDPTIDKEMRLELLDIYTKKLPFTSDEERLKILGSMSNMTSGFTSIELNKLTDIVAKTLEKRIDNKLVTPNDMIEAFLEVVSGKISKVKFGKWDNEATIIHECGHAIVGEFMSKLADAPWNKTHGDNGIIAFDARDFAQGAVYPQENENNYISFNSLIAEMALDYASFHSERKKYGTNFNGISSDLENATALVTDAVTKYGLGPSVGILAPAQNPMLMSTMSDKIYDDINLISTAASEISRRIVEFHEGFSQQFVDKYLENIGKGGNSLSGEQFKILLNNWYKKTKKPEDIQNLQNEITEIIEKAKKGEYFDSEKNKHIYT